MDGILNDQGATLSICPVWILSPSELKRKQSMKKIKMSENSRRCLYRLQRTQLERYLNWIEKQPRQAKRSHTIREIDSHCEHQTEMFSRLLASLSAIDQ